MLRVYSHLAVDPSGTGIFVDRVVLVEVDPPWPNKIIEHALFTNLEPTFELGLLFE